MIVVEAINVGESSETCNTLDKDKDGTIDRTEFSRFWSRRGNLEASRRVVGEEPGGESGGSMY
jgi:hypothetical protein